MFKKAPLAAALFGLTLTAATPAFAGETTKIRVEYADLDLTTPEGQHVLERRLNTAAREACGMDRMTTGTRVPSAHARKCFKQASARAKQVMASAIDKAADQSRLGG